MKGSTESIELHTAGRCYRSRINTRSVFTECVTYTLQNTQTSLGPPQRGHQILLIILAAQVLHTLFHCRGVESTKQPSHTHTHLL